MAHLYSFYRRLWDRYLSASLFANRHAFLESLRFSPFKLVYGHEVRGCRYYGSQGRKRLKINEVRTTYQHIVDQKERLEVTCKKARENLENNQKETAITTTTKVHGRDRCLWEKRFSFFCESPAISFLCNGRGRSQLWKR